MKRAGWGLLMLLGGAVAAVCGGLFVVDTFFSGWVSVGGPRGGTAGGNFFFLMLAIGGVLLAWTGFERVRQ